MKQFEQNLKLSDRERESISYLTLLCSTPVSDGHGPRQVSNQSHSDSDNHKQINNPSKYPLEPIRTTQQFLTWFAAIEQEMEQSQEEGLRQYLARLESTKNQIEKMQSQIQSIYQTLDLLTFNFEFVTSKTRSLQNACEQLLDEQKHLVSVSDDVSVKMKYFQELEHISKALNQPGEELVKEAGFSELLKKLDDCLEFIQKNV